MSLQTRNDELLRDQVIAQPKTMRIALMEAVQDVKHSGDYGTVWYHPIKQEVWVTMGDADGSDASHTKPEDIQRRLKLPGIRKVHLELEHDPNSYDTYKDDEEIDNDWEDLGVMGTLPKSLGLHAPEVEL